MHITATTININALVIHTSPIEGPILTASANNKESLLVVSKVVLAMIEESRGTIKNKQE